MLSVIYSFSFFQTLDFVELRIKASTLHDIIYAQITLQIIRCATDKSQYMNYEKCLQKMHAHASLILL